MISKIVHSKWFSLIVGLSLVYTGLGWLGIVGGWSNVGSLFSIAGGIIFLACGAVMLWRIFFDRPQ